MKKKVWRHRSAIARSGCGGGADGAPTAKQDQGQ